MKLEEMKTACDINAEKHLVSQLIMDNDVIYSITDIQLKPQDFFNKECKKIFGAIYSIIGQGKVADSVTISNKIGDLDLDITLLALTTEGSKEYAEIIKTCSIKRDISNKAVNLSMIAKETSTSIDELKKRADDMLNICMLQEHQKDFQEELEEFFLELYEAPKQKIKTGYKIIDSKLNLGKGQLVTIAGRPGMGKSAVMSCLALNIENCAFFSLEMGKREIAYRMSSSISGVEFGKISNGIAGLPETEQEKIKKSFDKIRDGKFAIYDRKISFIDIKMEIKKLKLTRNIEVVFVDYLQLIRGEDTKAPRSQQIGLITRELKSIAKEHDVLIVMGSQLNRQVESRRGKAQLSDLRESGDIEQDSDIVIFVERDKEDTPEIMELQVAKYRNGSPCDISLRFDTKTMTIKDEVGNESSSDENSIF